MLPILQDWKIASVLHVAGGLRGAVLEHIGDRTLTRHRLPGFRYVSQGSLPSFFAVKAFLEEPIAQPALILACSVL